MAREIFDINRPLGDGKAAALLPTLGSRMDPSVPMAALARVDSVDAYVASLHAAMGDITTRADEITKQVSAGILEACKALGVVPPQAFSYSSMSFLPDPANYGLMQWPGINPESLRKIVRENVSPTVIIQQRSADLARYSGQSAHFYQPGWRITMRESSETPTAQDREDMKRAERFIYNCSMEGSLDPRERDASLIAPFEVFLRGFINDTLTFDGWAVWTDMKGGHVNAFANLPAGMIRLAMPTRGYKGNMEHFAALVDETGTPVKPLTRNELVWRIRNVRNDPSVGGYGWPEPEMLVRIIQAFQGGVELNAGQFVNNSIPNGMMLLKGDYFNQDQVDALMREWTNMKRGMSKLWGMPVMAIPEDGNVEIVNFMDLKGQDIRFRDHMNLMMGLNCLVYCFPIRRLGMFASGHSRDNQPTQDAAIEIQGADDPGLPPLLQFVEDTINPYILWTRWPRLKFGFMAKNPKEDARQTEARKLARTWGEARAEADLPKLSKLAPTKLKPLAEIMELAPEDAVKAGIFQTVAVKMLEAQLGLDGGGDPDKAGPPMQIKKDPAEAQGHGHLAGVRRNSRQEKDRAARNSGTSA
jgi:hypothetical protein